MGAIEVVIDTVILALPVRMVLGLNLSRKRKISLVLIFLLGGLYATLDLISPFWFLLQMTRRLIFV